MKISHTYTYYVLRFIILITMFSCQKESMTEVQKIDKQVTLRHSKLGVVSGNEAKTPVGKSFEQLVQYLDSLSPMQRDTALLNLVLSLRSEKRVEMNSLLGDMNNVDDVLAWEKGEGVLDIPLDDVELTKIVPWKVASNIFGFWEIMSTETITGNSTGFISIVHNGSEIEGLMSTLVGWTESSNVPYCSPQVALMKVKGTTVFLGVNNSYIDNYKAFNFVDTSE